VTHLDLEAAALQEWSHPLTAGRAAPESQKRLAAGLISLQLDLISQHDLESQRMAERKLEKQIDYVQKLSMLLASLLKAEQV
jgi:hypothetical protein